MISLSLYMSAIENETDRDFFERLYIAYGKDMKLYAQSIIGRNHAEDCLHNAFLKLIPKIDLLREIHPEKRRTYIIMTVKSCAYDIMRIEKKYIEIDEELENCLEDPGTPIVDKIIEDEGYEYLKSSIRNLSDTYREACEMKYVLHMKEREIAVALGLSEKNVNARVFRGKKILQKMIQEKYYGK